MSKEDEVKRRGPGRPRKPTERELEFKRERERLERELGYAMAPPPGRVLSQQDVADKLGRSPTTVNTLRKHDPLFPAAFALTGDRASCWLESDIDAYLRLKAKLAQEAKQAKLAAPAAREAKQGQFEDAA